MIFCNSLAVLLVSSTLCMTQASPVQTENGSQQVPTADYTFLLSTIADPIDLRSESMFGASYRQREHHAPQQQLQSHLTGGEELTRGLDHVDVVTPLPQEGSSLFAPLATDNPVHFSSSVATPSPDFVEQGHFIPLISSGRQEVLGSISSTSSTKFKRSAEMEKRLERLQRKELARQKLGSSSRAVRYTTFWKSLHIRERLALVAKVAELTKEDPNFLWTRLDVRCDDFIARALLSKDEARQLHAIWEIDSYLMPGDVLKVMEKRRLNRLIQAKHNMEWKSASNVRTLGLKNFTPVEKDAIRNDHAKTESVYEWLAEKLYASYLRYHDTRNQMRKEQRKERKRLAEEFQLK